MRLGLIISFGFLCDKCYYYCNNKYDILRMLCMNRLLIMIMALSALCLLIAPCTADDPTTGFSYPDVLPMDGMISLSEMPPSSYLPPTPDTPVFGEVCKRLNMTPLGVMGTVYVISIVGGYALVELPSVEIGRAHV